MAADGGFAFTGYTLSYRDTGHDIFLVKTNPDGDVPNCPDCASVTPAIISPDFGYVTTAAVLASETVDQSMVTPTSNFHDMGFYFLCGFPFDTFMPLVLR